MTSDRAGDNESGSGKTSHGCLGTNNIFLGPFFKGIKIFQFRQPMSYVACEGVQRRDSESGRLSAGPRALRSEFQNEIKRTLEH
jgi:hypothetical protein